MRKKSKIIFFRASPVESMLLSALSMEANQNKAEFLRGLIQAEAKRRGFPSLACPVADESEGEHENPA